MIYSLSVEDAVLDPHFSSSWITGICLPEDVLDSCDFSRLFHSAYLAIRLH